MSIKIKLSQLQIDKDLDLDGKKIIGSGPPTEPGDSLTKEYGDLYYTFSGIGTQFPPSNSTDIGDPGQIAYDDDYIYICVSTNRWLRIMGIKNF